MTGIEQIAVVSGASLGIRREIARQLARREIRVVLTGRDAAKGEAALSALAAEELRARFHELDVRKPEQALALMNWLDHEYGRLDILVNNAGVLLDPKGARVATIDVDIVLATLETNVLGPLLVTQAVLPLMRKVGHGRIVNLSSGLGQLESLEAGAPAYRISKVALNALTRTLAAELRGTGIKVNSMCPGWVRTGMGVASAPRSPEEAADTAVWLATLPDDGPSGGFFRDRKQIPW